MRQHPFHQSAVSREHRVLTVTRLTGDGRSGRRHGVGICGGSDRGGDRGVLTALLRSRRHGWMWLFQRVPPLQHRHHPLGCAPHRGGQPVDVVFVQEVVHVVIVRVEAGGEEEQVGSELGQTREELFRDFGSVERKLQSTRKSDLRL